jgi:DNA-binding response OmpR family regulator
MLGYENRLLRRGMSAEKVVLVVDDSVLDCELIKRSLRQAGFPIAVHCVCDMQGARSYLSGEGRYTERELFPFPSLVILDHHLAGTAEWDVLRWIREQEFKALPVVVFSGSEQPETQKAALALGANAYHVKPTNFDEFNLVMGTILEQCVGGAAS